MKKKTIIKLRRFFGNQTDMADSLGVDKSTVSNWLRGFRPISVRQAVIIDNVTEGLITMEEIRPDIFI